MTVAARANKTPSLAGSVATLRGVGPERASQLSRLGVHTIEDLLLHKPRRYEDRRHIRPIAELHPDEPGITRGRVVAVGVKWFKQHTRSICEVILDDDTARLHCRWWNLPYMEKYFAVGDEVVAFGKLVSSKPRTMDHPETEVIVSGEEAFIHLNRITPIYPLTEGLPQRWLRGLIWRVLGDYESVITEPWPELLNLTPGLETRARAIHWLHFPEQVEEVERARRRLALDEFIELQRQMQIRRKNLQTKAKAILCRGDNRLIKPFLADLGFKLTDSQTEVLRELRRDLSCAHPMRRLLQGDVGSGKTVIAACCALMALESGHSVALMAPTEILAEQHFSNFSRWFRPLRVRVELWTGTHKPQGMARSSGVPQDPAAAVCLTIGTHALLSAGFELPNLGLVIIDEQHKFGVSQREELVRKGPYPHLLVMTATPIPRTLGLTLYGDLDVSTIAKPPPGRGRIRTFVRAAEALPKVWSFVRNQLKQGRQAYVIYPRIDESGAAGIKAVTTEFDVIKQALAPYRAGLLHGRLASKDKEAIMAQFRDRQLQVLVATALIEVGVDIPNATVMVVENAEQFGLAQLHQLRGRIGRGSADAYCILIAAARTREARQRLRILEETSDGFKIAEADLKIRGAGQLLGQEQSGVPHFRFGDLGQDLDLIQQARQVAAEIVKQTP